MFSLSPYPYPSSKTSKKRNKQGLVCMFKLFVAGGETPPLRIKCDSLPPEGGGLRSKTEGVCRDRRPDCPFAVQASSVWAGGSLRLGHATALTSHRDVIHYRVAASLPRLSVFLFKSFVLNSLHHFVVPLTQEGGLSLVALC